MTIYDRIKERRIELGMSQAELAQRVGYHGKSVISKVENGERDISQTMIVKYAEALGVTATYLLIGENAEQSTPQKINNRVNEFISLFTQLTDEQQKMLIAQMKGLLSNQ